jgi:antirestriction protein ArdC
MRDVYAKLTDQIVISLEKGVKPWFQPWTSTFGGRAISRPLRFNGKPYRGINVIMLWITAEIEGYSNPYWMTFKQAKELGGHVRKGQRGADVIFANRITVKKDTDDEHNVSILRSYTVFNCDQIDDLPEKYHSKPTVVEKPRMTEAETFFANLGIDLRHGGGRAFYSPSQDFVQMPNFADFATPADYYCTLGHESAHWTKAEKRLNRNLGQQRWGDEGYAVEELVAELASVFLAADLGITAQPRSDHAAYVANWLTVLKNDKRAIFTAAAMAERAVAYLHQQQPGYVAETDGES